MTTMLPLMESRPRMQRTHEVKSGEPATNVTIHTYAGNTRSMHKKYASVRIIFEDTGVLSQTIQGLHHEGRESVMAWKGNAQGASAKADHWHFIVGLVAVLVVAAGLLLGVWAWSSHVKAESLADCRSQAASAARNVKAYKTDRAAAQRRARAIPPGDVSDVKVVAAVDKAAKPSVPAVPSCSVDDSWSSLRALAQQAAQVAAKADAADRGVKAASEKVAHDEARTVKAHLDKAIADGDSLLSGSDGQVADNAVRDALKTVLDQAKAVQADAKADTNARRKAIQDLANQMQAVNDSKTDKANADQEAADQQAQQAAVAAPAPSSGHTRGGSASTSARPNGSRYARGGSRSGQTARRGGGSGGGYTAPAPSSGGSGSSYAPAPDHYTQEQIDGAHHYLCIMEPDITSGC